MEDCSFGQLNRAGKKPVKILGTGLNVSFGVSGKQVIADKMALADFMRNQMHLPRTTLYNLRCRTTSVWTPNLPLFTLCHNVCNVGAANVILVSKNQGCGNRKYKILNHKVNSCVCGSVFSGNS